MFGVHDLWLFVLSGLLLNITGNTFKQWFNRCVGTVFVFVGIRLALAHDR